jgi:hypothetical protein
MCLTTHKPRPSLDNFPFGYHITTPCNGRVTAGVTNLEVLGAPEGELHLEEPRLGRLGFLAADLVVLRGEQHPHGAWARFIIVKSITIIIIIVVVVVTIIILIVVVVVVVVFIIIIIITITALSILMLPLPCSSSGSGA